MNSIIKYKKWDTGEEKEYNPSCSLDTLNQTNLICPFDNTPLFDRSYYHNEHDLFCPNCGGVYPPKSNQKEIKNQSREDALRNKKQLQELEEKKADLEARIKHAEEVGLI
jgi:uncharacterized Zn finger protein (UPF0148 family)